METKEPVRQRIQKNTPCLRVPCDILSLFFSGVPESEKTATIRRLLYGRRRGRTPREEPKISGISRSQHLNDAVVGQSTQQAFHSCGKAFQKTDDPDTFSVWRHFRKIASGQP